MKLTSPAFADHDFIPPRFTCDGENTNPPLTIEAVIPGVKSLVLIVDDPDAPGGDWVHWLVWDIPPETTTIAENSVPLGAIQGINDFGEVGYGGPCPPSDTHRYQFSLYGISQIVAQALSPLAKKADLLQFIDDHLIDQTQLVGFYHRQ